MINMHFNKKLIFFIILCLFIISNFFSLSIAKTKNFNNTEDPCFGYIIPLPSGLDNTYETMQNSKVRFLINDLLREKVQVYWNINPLIINVKTLSKKNINLKFNNGTFLIPFTDDELKDKLISSIITDYNISSEINYIDNIRIPIYLLSEEINIEGLKLSEAKIVQHYDIPTRYGWPCYLQIAESGGFLNFDFLIENDIKKLNNNDYNVFMWPYEPAPARLSEVAISLSKRNEFEIIRSFVNKGGGYIGSCYGALAASSGFLNPLSGLHVLQSYYSGLPPLPLSFTISLSDSIMMERIEVLDDLYISYSKIVDNSHPITYGINKTVKEFFSGPWFIWLGRNTELISIFEDVTLENNETIPDFIRDKVEKSPSWVTSQFGNGKLVLFTSHPEFINNISFLFENRDWNADNYYGRRVIFNSLMYVTSQHINSIKTNNLYSSEIIFNIINKTKSLNIITSPEDNFSDFKNSIYNYQKNLLYLKNQSYNQMKLYDKIFNETNIYPNDSRPLIYTYAFCDILQDYINKSMNSIETINDVYYTKKLHGINSSNRIDFLKELISKNMNETNKLFHKSQNISNDINNLFNTYDNSKNKILIKSLIVEKTRKLITTFEISLKYFPQIYFEILKSLNHEWYNYESKSI